MVDATKENRKSVYAFGTLKYGRCNLVRILFKRNENPKTKKRNGLYFYC